MSTYDHLIQCALQARDNAYAPYSNFLVGVAIEVEGHEDPVVGCNVENASYGLAVCAERNAIGAAVATGLLKSTRDSSANKLQRVIIVAHPLATPCGACRQFIAEFNIDTEIVCVDADNLADRRTWVLRELLPENFKLR